MSWYYAENNEQRGPVDDATFTSLARGGTIRPDTLVWKEGMAAWIPYSEVPLLAAAPVLSSAAAAAFSPVPGEANYPATAARTGVPAQMCSQCSRLFPPDDLIVFEGRYVCAECKPLFFQKIKEGAHVTTDVVYAGFWIRFAAKLVDGIILQIVNRIVLLAAGLSLNNPKAAANPAILLPAIGLGLGLQVIYVIFFNGKYGATPGKMACKLHIIRSDGEPLSYARATGRFFAEFVSGLTLGIGYAMAGWDDEKRALHDRIADTRVVKNR